MNDVEPTGRTVPVLDAVLEQVRDRPDAEAVRAPREALGYRELWDRATQVAARAAQLGAGPRTTVGVHLERSADLVVAFLGLLRAGCAVVPLDVAYPPDRLRFMCADAEVQIVVGHEEALERLDQVGPVVVDHGIAFGRIGAGDAPGGDVPAFEAPDVAGDDVAYVIYTSGSTGRPKGVQYAHRNLLNLVSWQVAVSACGPGDRTLQFAPASFDVVFQEVLTTLSEGGTLVCCTEDERLDPQLLWELVARERIARLFVPFVMIQSLALFTDDVDPVRCPLREVITTGEQVRATAAIRAMFTRLPRCRLVNQWGTTETHTATSYELPADPATWPDLPPIGRPIEGTALRVCDPQGRPVPDGDVGELWVVGAAVGPGYLGLPDRTSRSFRPDPRDPTTPAYRSGDLGRRDGDGLLEYVGREDSMVKVRGFRVELGEIESVLTTDPSVAQAAAVVTGRAAEERTLRAFLVPRTRPDDEAAWTAGLHALLRDRLPPYMVPGRLEVLRSLPRTPSGKVDRLALGAGGAA